MSYNPYKTKSNGGEMPPPLVIGILTCLVIVVIIIAVEIHEGVITFDKPVYPPCYVQKSNECFDYRLQQCLDEEWGTKDQCLLRAKGFGE